MTNFSFCVLGSGSSGNCSLLQIEPNRWVMIDAGFSMKQTKERMQTHNICINDISDLLLTHLDRDHFNPAWCRTLTNRKIKVRVHEKHLDRAICAGLDRKILHPFTDEISFGDMHSETIHMEHDSLGTVGFVFTQSGFRFGFATDLGHVPKLLLESFINLDAIAIESNYDPTMQRTSGRPISLQDRITGGSGHLSNEESIAAVEKISEQSALQHIVLLHLSRQCNSPSIIQDLYQNKLAHLYSAVTISSQDRCSRLLRLEKEGFAAATSLF
ncbi:MAG: MBL fold metallo-hydrolase [Phycisphaerales bacterium]|nr:MBL fold metallo-hydrolase [Phycisphaerales bacterium]